jgi:hypothetical protein
MSALLLLPPPKRPGKGNAFEVLGVSPDASIDEINREYRYLARLYHPDVNPGGHEEYVRINQAYTEATNQGDYARLKLKCDVVEAKASHAEFLKLIWKIKTLAGIEIPPVPPGEMARRDDNGQAARLGLALMFRCPVCRWQEACDRATGFGEVAHLHHEFLKQAMRVKR